MAMQWLLKVFQHIISGGEEDAPIRYYTTDDNIVSFPGSPLLQSTTPTVVTPATEVHSLQVNPPPDRPPSIVPWSTALANKSINTLQSKPSPSVGQSTRPPPIAQLSPALATTNILSKASPSPGLSKRPPPPTAHSSSTTTHSSLLQSARPTTATSPIVIHSSPKELAREEGRASTTLPPELGNLNTHAKNLKSVLQRYEIPKHLKELIERDKVPPVLLGAVSLATYEDYFACLLYAEDYYIEGIIFRVVKRVVLVEFEDDFHAQHTSTKKYDVSFSFNRVCLKRAHRAVSAAKDTSFHDILFPERRFTSSFPFLSPSNRILNHEGTSPYLLEGPLSTSLSGQLSVIGSLIQDATLKIYQSVPNCRILICAPRNQTCDSLMRNLQTVIPRSKLFRANAAFRDYDLVPDDIIPACLYEGECFTCPPLNELQNFKVVTSTFMSSFRLHYAGISAEHFTHIFLVDASSATEPETIVALADLVSKKTVVVVTGSSTDIPRYIRSDIARMHGLSKSYFKRLLESEPYSTRDPNFITHLKGSQ